MAVGVSQLNTLIPSGGVYEAVDLGLPSGTKWARFNIGATSETDYGDLFAWGATEPYLIGRGNTNNYPSSKAGTIQHDLLPYEDAATILWGSGWRMPTNAQFEELIANTTTEWTSISNVNGLKCTGGNGNYIFLPANGYYENLNNYNKGSIGRYWSGAYSSNSGSNRFGFSSSTIEVRSDYRAYGMCIRPVKV